MARTTRALRRLILRGVQIVLIALAAAIVLLYGWAFLTLKDEDLKAGADADHRSGHRKIVLDEQGHREREGFPHPDLKGVHGSRLVMPPSPPPPKRAMKFPFTDDKYRIYKLPENDTSERCRLTGICDGDHTCGPDKLGCVTSGKDRQARVREAARWSWAGYRCGESRPRPSQCFSHMFISCLFPL
jgi:hypothetical protein